MCSSLCDTIFPCIYARVRIRDGSTSLISSHTSPAHTHSIPSTFPLQEVSAIHLRRDSLCRILEPGYIYAGFSHLFPKRSYQLDNTVSHQICAVKQAWAELVLGLVTTRESSVTLFFFFHRSFLENVTKSQNVLQREISDFRFPR